MSHYLTIEDEFAGPRLTLICTATPDAPCRMRPSDDTREEWRHDDPDLTPGNPCWAVEWVEEGGWETVASADDAKWPRIPVTVKYDEGVVIAPAAPHSALDWQEPDQ